MGANKITVLVVDDSSFMRSMLPRLIQRDERFEVIDTAKDGKEGVEKALSLKPDIVTMDIEMPVMNGLEALDQIMAKQPMPILMISSLTEEGAQATIDALDKGAVDFIPKALDDQERNVIKMAEVIHEKLAAAVKSKVDSLSAPAPTPRIAPVVPTATAAPSTTTSPTSRLTSAQLLMIGSSTGGPRALQSIVPHLKADLRVPVVIAQHMPAGFTTAMANRLNETSPIKVCEAEDGQKLEAGTVYIAPGGMHLRIVKLGADMKLSVAENKGESLYKPSVDVLAESALSVFGKNILGIMLTGMGEDGAKNYLEIKGVGGHIIAQDEESSTVYGMPRAVKDKGGASEILPLQDIVQRVNMLLS